MKTNLEEKQELTRKDFYAMKLLSCLQEVENEILNAKEKYPNNYNSTHEGLAVLEEEFLELRDEIFWGKKRHDESVRTDLASKEWREATAKQNHKVAIREEARQVAAMALRIMVELT